MAEFDLGRPGKKFGVRDYRPPASVLEKAGQPRGPAGIVYYPSVFAPLKRGHVYDDATKFVQGYAQALAFMRPAQVKLAFDKSDMYLNWQIHGVTSKALGQRQPSYTEWQQVQKETLGEHWATEGKSAGPAEMNSLAADLTYDASVRKNLTEQRMKSQAWCVTDPDVQAQSEMGRLILSKDDESSTDVHVVFSDTELYMRTVDALARQNKPGSLKLVNMWGKQPALDYYTDKICDDAGRPELMHSKDVSSFDAWRNGLSGMAKIRVDKWFESPAAPSAHQVFMTSYEQAYVGMKSGEASKNGVNGHSRHVEDILLKAAQEYDTLEVSV